MSAAFKQTGLELSYMLFFPGAVLSNPPTDAVTVICRYLASEIIYLEPVIRSGDGTAYKFAVYELSLDSPAALEHFGYTIELAIHEYALITSSGP